MPEPTSPMGPAQPGGHSGRAIALAVAPEDLPLMAERLLHREWFLEDICGLDVSEGFVLLYHFAHWSRPGRVALRVLIDREGPKCPTIEAIYPGASWHEREAHDFFGIAFTGAANDMPLLLAEKLDPPPLRKAPQARMSTRRLWPQSEWPGAAEGQALAGELMAPRHCEETGGEAVP